MLHMHVICVYINVLYIHGMMWCVSWCVGCVCVLYSANQNKTSSGIDSNSNAQSICQITKHYGLCDWLIKKQFGDSCVSGGLFAYLKGGGGDGGGGGGINGIYLYIPIMQLLCAWNK